MATKITLGWVALYLIIAALLFLYIPGEVPVWLVAAFMTVAIFGLFLPYILLIEDK